MYLSSIEATLPWVFAYDRQNYARYLLPFLNDMLELRETMLLVHEAFFNGEFSVQMGKVNPFGQNEVAIKLLRTRITKIANQVP